MNTLIAFATRKFCKGLEAIDAIINGKPLTKKQKEAKERREQKEAEFHLKCSIIDEMKEYPILYDKAHPSHYKCDCKEEVNERIGAALDMEGNRIFIIYYYVFQCWHI